MPNPTSILLIPILCVFQLSEFEQGKQLYDSRHYRQASETFGKLVQERKAPALTHYYYANSLWKIGKKDEALESYQRVVELSPKSKIGSYALDVLSKSSQTRPAQPVNFPNGAVEQTNPIQSESNKAILASNDLSNTVSDVIKTKLGKRLPKLVEDFRHGTTLKEYQELGNEVGVNSRWYTLRARDNWDCAKANLDYVSKIAIDLVPLHRDHNESVEDFALRRAEYSRQATCMCECYRQNERALQAYYEQQLEVYELYCQKNGKSLELWWP